VATQTVALTKAGAQPSAGVLLPAFTLWWREIVRFYRQKSRVVGVLASPLLFWVVIGSGFGTSFRSGAGQGQQNYLDYFYPGALIMIVLFTSIFAMMSLIEDRKEGFLLSVMVAPVPRSAIVLGKVLGGTTLSAIQGMIFLIFAPFAGIHLNLSQVLLVAVVVFLVSFALTALGFAVVHAGGWLARRPALDRFARWAPLASAGADVIADGAGIGGGRFGCGQGRGH